MLKMNKLSEKGSQQVNEAKVMRLVFSVLLIFASGVKYRTVFAKVTDIFSGV